MTNLRITVRQNVSSDSVCGNVIRVQFPDGSVMILADRYGLTKHTIRLFSKPPEYSLLWVRRFSMFSPEIQNHIQTAFDSTFCDERKLPDGSHEPNEDAILSLIDHLGETGLQMPSCTPPTRRTKNE